MILLPAGFILYMQFSRLIQDCPLSVLRDDLSLAADNPHVVNLSSSINKPLYMECMLSTLTKPLHINQQTLLLLYRGLTESCKKKYFFFIHHMCSSLNSKLELPVQSQRSNIKVNSTWCDFQILILQDSCSEGCCTCPTLVTKR